MTTANRTAEKPAINTEVLEALRNRFGRQASALRSQPEEDQALADLAKSILAECVGRDDLVSRFYNTRIAQEEIDARAEEATELLKVLEARLKKETGAIRTYRLLWDTLLEGWRTTNDAPSENKFARAILAIPRQSGTESETQLDTAIREGMKDFRYDTARLLRLIATSNSDSNEIVVRRAFQTLGKAGKIPELSFAVRALHSLGKNPEGTLIGVGEMCLRHIERMAQIHEAASDIKRGYLTGEGLPNINLAFREEGFRTQFFTVDNSKFTVTEDGVVELIRYVPVPQNGFAKASEQVRAWLPDAKAKLGKWRSDYSFKNHTPRFPIKLILRFVQPWGQFKKPEDSSTIEEMSEII